MLFLAPILLRFRIVSATDPHRLENVPSQVSTFDINGKAAKGLFRRHRERKYFVSIIDVQHKVTEETSHTK